MMVAEADSPAIPHEISTRLLRRVQDDFALELARLEALFTERKPDARDQVATAHRLRVVHLSHLRLASASAWLRLDHGRSDEMERRALEIEEELDAIEQLRERYRDWNGLQNDEGPTAETAVKQRRRDPIAVLVANGRLDERHQRAATDIAIIFYEVSKSLFAKSKNMESAGRAPPRSGFIVPPIDEEIAERHAKVYKPWAGAMEQRLVNPLPLVFDVVVEGRALGTVVREQRCGYATGLARLNETLIDYYHRLREFERATRDDGPE